MVVCITSKGAYALSAMIYLARQGDRVIQIKEVADTCNIPQNYLEQLLVQLKRAGFLESVRGARGGYKMAVRAEKVTVLQVLDAMESEAANLEKYGGESRALNYFWAELNEKIAALLSVPIQALSDREMELNQTANYSI